MLDLPARSEGGADALALTFPSAVAKQTRARGLAPSTHGFGLAARVLAVTIGFVLLAMGLFYVTRLTAHREMLLHGKISAVRRLSTRSGWPDLLRRPKTCRKGS